MEFIKNNYVEINLGDVDKILTDYTNITKNIRCDYAAIDKKDHDLIKFGYQEILKWGKTQNHLTIKNDPQCTYQILLDIHNICIENNLKYWIEGGTLLGAVRHKDFIPVG